MGSNGSSGGGGNTGREKGITNQYSGPKGTTEKDNSGLKKVGSTFEKIVSNLPSVRAVRAITNTVRQGRVNTSLMGTSDYQGTSTRSNVGDLGNNNGGDNGGAMTTSGQVVQAPQPVGTPTTVEISQSENANVSDSALLRNRKVKVRGRSLTINTSPTGAIGSLTLGKPSLLGR